MIKELVIYKNPDKEFVLKNWEKTTDKHRRLFFESNENLQYDDLLWAKEDLEKGTRKNMLVIENVYEDGSVRVRLADESFMKKLRSFDDNEVFLLVASYRESKDGNNKIHIS